MNSDNLLAALLWEVNLVDSVALKVSSTESYLSSLDVQLNLVACEVVCNLEYSVVSANLVAVELNDEVVASYAMHLLWLFSVVVERYDFLSRAGNLLELDVVLVSSTLNLCDSNVLLVEYAVSAILVHAVIAECVEWNCDCATLYETNCCLLLEVVE